MIKKYFALSLITVSMLAAGCSDDDDDDAVDVPDVVATPADITNDSSAFDVVANSTDHEVLEQLIVDAGLADTLDDPATAGGYTIFAPTDTAFGNVDVTALSTADVERLLQYHVVAGTLTTTSISDSVTADVSVPYTEATLLTDGSLTFSVPDGSGLSVTDSTDVTVLLASELQPAGEGAAGSVFSIDTVLTPPAPVVPDNSGGDIDPAAVTTAGELRDALEAAGNYTQFLELGFLEAIVANGWTVFVPNDEVLDASEIELNGQDLISVAGGLTLEALVIAGTITTNDNVNGASTYDVTNVDGVVLVDGKAINLIATSSGGSTVYGIDGVLE